MLCYIHRFIVIYELGLQLLNVVELKNVSSFFEKSFILLNLVEISSNSEFCTILGFM